jgi:hypothetical protein
MFRRMISYMTFPGVMAHEFAHAWACKRLRLHVHKVCYFRFGNPLGYVLHEQPVYVSQHIMVAVAPFFVSTTLALLISFLVSCLARAPVYPEARETIAIAGLWVSFSFALHAFPSCGDADSLWSDVKSPAFGWPAKLLLVPVVGVIRLTQLGARLWLDVLFALLIVALPPAILLVVTV